MIQIRRLALFTLFALAGATPLAADFWARPATTPNTDVKCSICVGSNLNQLTPGYPATVGKFVGRYLDSQPVKDWQQPFRTARARNVVAMPSINRLYFIIGSSVMSYNMDRFFQRVAAGETLADVHAVPVSWAGYDRSPYDEVFLNFDGFFYAEADGWDCPVTDGQERLYAIDADDQGYVYLATRLFRWGILKDDLSATGSTMSSVVQQPAGSDDVGPLLIASLKTSTGAYYAVISDTTTSTLNVFDVTDRTNPQKHPNLTKSMYRFAKNSTSTVVGIATVDGRFEIYTTDAFVSNGRPLVSDAGANGGSVRGVACDGTNFYVSSDASGGLVISTYTSNGAGGYRKVADFPTRRYTLATNHLNYGGGYLVQSGFTDGSYELRLFKANSASDVSEVDLSIPAAPGNNVTPYYFKNYYISNNSGRSGYVAGGLFCLFYDSTIVKRNGHTYLIVTGYGLGDVYELPGGDSIIVQTAGSVGTPNPNRPAGGSAGPFYGDPVGFTASTTAAAQTNITWDFGNPEAAAAADPNSGPGLTGTQITHRYSGLTSASSLPTTRTVSATSITNSTVTGSIPVTLVKPAVSVAIKSGTAVLPLSSSTPIVVGDNFVDTSDGSVQSHFDSWTIDATGTKTLPSESLSVGACAASHTLAMTAHYGPYTGTSPNESSLSDMPISIAGATYSVRPFGATISTAPSTDSIVFSANVRVTADTTVLSAAQASALQYKWQLVDASNNTILTGPTGTGTVPTFSVPKSTFTSRGIRGRLTLTSPTAVTGACAGLNMESGDAYTQPINGPDPIITGGCTSGGPPCSFGVASASNVDPVADGWTYTWSVQPATFRGATNGATFTPTFTATGQYIVSVLVTNAVGSSPASKTITVTNIPPVCDTMLPGTNVFIAFQSATGSCSFTGGACGTNEPITFNAASYLYDFGCDTHTFTWSFGDGAVGSGKTLTHSYGAAGVYTVSLTIKNTSQQVTTSVQVTVGQVQQKCVLMVANSNVFPVYGAPSGCSFADTTKPCSLSETITFTAGATAYDYTCAVHTFTWDFGDGTGTTTSSLSVQHAYTQIGTYTASLSISNGTQSVTGMTVPVRIAQKKIDCLPLTPGVSVFPVWAGPTSQCSPTSGDVQCRNDEDVAFTVAAFNYSFDCAKHAFVWDFGDHTPTVASAPGDTVPHRYAGGGSYNLVLTVNITYNDGTTSTVTIPATVKVLDVLVASGCPYDFSVEPRVVGGVLLANEFVFTVTGIKAGTTPTFTWDFGDGTKTTTTAPQQSHTYPDDHTYTVTLTVSNSNCHIQHDVVKPRRRAAGR